MMVVMRLGEVESLNRRVLRPQAARLPKCGAEANHSVAGEVVCARWDSWGWMDRGSDCAVSSEPPWSRAA